MSNKELVRLGYNKAAFRYLEVRSEHLEEMKLLLEFAGRLSKGARVLDAGCGAGIPFTKFLSQSFDVIGVDFSETQIALALELVPKARFLCQDVTELSFPDEHFDGIISYYTIIHIPREEHKGVLENFYRMLKKGGMALLCFSTIDDPGSYEEDFFGVRMYWSGYDTETNIAMLKEAGFSIIWSKLISDSLGDNKHLFVLAQKS